ncbi:MAG TPA: hypothetical protein PLP48_03965 [Acholeplasmataceae bacterium]|nr:hypothetical protein [Acholeplasmataceae bacterium]
MNNHKKELNFKKGVIAQLVLSSIYLVLGIVLFILFLIKIDGLGSDSLGWTMSLLIVGLIAFIISLITFKNKSVLRKRTIKHYDETRRDIQLKSSSYSYYFVMFFLFLITVLIGQRNNEFAAMLLLVILLTLVVNLFIKYALTRIYTKGGNSDETSE